MLFLQAYLPALLALGLGQDDLAAVLLAEVVEQVLVQTGVLAVVRRNLEANWYLTVCNVMSKSWSLKGLFTD